MAPRDGRRGGARCRRARGGVAFGLARPGWGIRRYGYEDRASTYSACLAGRLAEWGDHAADGAALAAASRHLNWALAHRRSNHWIALAGFDEEQHQADEAFTHTIAYTLAGILSTAATLGRSDGITRGGLQRPGGWRTAWSCRGFRPDLLAATGGDAAALPV